MLSFGFSTPHWQQVEAGRPITVTTLLRICEVFEISMAKLVRGLDGKGVLRGSQFRDSATLEKRTETVSEKNGRAQYGSAAFHP